MGVDVYSHSGVVVTESQMAMIVRDENCEQVCREVLRYTAIIFQKLRQDTEDTELGDSERSRLEEQAKLLSRCFKSLTAKSSVSDVRTMLLSLTKGVADGYDSYVENADLAIEVWGMLIEQLHPEADPVRARQCSCLCLTRLPIIPCWPSLLVVARLARGFRDISCH